VVREGVYGVDPQKLTAFTTAAVLITRYCTSGCLVEILKLIHVTGKLKWVYSFIACSSFNPEPLWTDGRWNGRWCTWEAEAEIREGLFCLAGCGSCSIPWRWLADVVFRSTASWKRRPPQSNCTGFRHCNAIFSIGVSCFFIHSFQHRFVCWCD